MYLRSELFNGGSRTAQPERDSRRKLKVFNHALEAKNVPKTCRYFGMTRETFYQWERVYNLEEGSKN